MHSGTQTGASQSSRQSPDLHMIPMRAAPSRVHERRTICNIGVTGDPATVSGAEENIVYLVVKHVFKGGACTHHVSCQSVLHPFGLARAPRGEELQANLPQSALQSQLLMEDAVSC